MLLATNLYLIIRNSFENQLNNRHETFTENRIRYKTHVRDYARWASMQLRLVRRVLLPSDQHRNICTRVCGWKLDG